MDMNAKKAKAEKAKQDETALNRVLCWIAGGAVLEFLLLLLNRYYNHYTVAQIELRAALGTAVKIIAIIALVLAGAAWYWHKTAKTKEKSGLFPGVVTLFMLGVSISCFATWVTGGTGLKLMYVALPAVIILALIYYLYQREFFMISCLCGVGLLGIWICSKALGGRYGFVAYIYLVLAAIVAVGGALVCRKIQASGGMMEFKGKNIKALSQNTNYMLIYISAILNLAALIGCVLGVPTMLLLGLLVAWMLVMAVYYTIKMM